MGELIGPEKPFIGLKGIYTWKIVDFRVPALHYKTCQVWIGHEAAGPNFLLHSFPSSSFSTENMILRATGFPLQL